MKKLRKTHIIYNIGYNTSGLLMGYPGSLVVSNTGNVKLMKVWEQQRISPNYVYGRIPSLTSLENKKVKRVILQNGFNEPKILENKISRKLFSIR